MQGIENIRIESGGLLSFDIHERYQDTYRIFHSFGDEVSIRQNGHYYHVLCSPERYHEAERELVLSRRRGITSGIVGGAEDLFTSDEVSQDVNVEMMRALQARLMNQGVWDHVMQEQQNNSHSCLCSKPNRKAAKEYQDAINDTWLKKPDAKIFDCGNVACILRQLSREEYKKVATSTAGPFTIHTTTSNPIRNNSRDMWLDTSIT